MSSYDQASPGAFADLYDFGENRSTPEEKLGPVWSFEADDNYSDWTIVVTNVKDKTQKKTYHVHRSVLCLGPRKSDYFAAICRGDGLFQETSSSTTQFHFPDLACKHFDLLLDFMYGWVVRDSDYLDQACIDELTALRYLARYLSIPILFNTVTSEIIPLLNFSEDPSYIDKLTNIMSSGEKLGDAALVCRATNTFALNLFQICRKPENLRLVKILTPELISSIFGAKRLDMIVYTYSFGHLDWKGGVMGEQPDETFLNQMRKARRRGYLLCPFLVKLSRELGAEDLFKEIRSHWWKLFEEAENDELERTLRQLARLGHLAKNSRLRPDLIRSSLSSGNFDRSYRDFPANFKFMDASDKIEMVELMINQVQKHSDGPVKTLEEWCKRDYSAMDDSMKLETLDQYIRWRLLEAHLS
jgi:hypothetical protein